MTLLVEERPVREEMEMDAAPRHRVSVVDVTPKIATQWLAKFDFEGQRKLNPKHVRFLADVMERGEFDGGESIRFVVVKSGGRRILINGRHRLNGIIASGFPQETVVVETAVDTMEGAATIYARVDRGMNRSMAEVLRALGAHEGTGLTYTQAGLVSAAGPLIESAFATGSQISGSVYETKSADARARYVTKHAVPASAFFAAIDGGDKRMTRLLQKAPVLAVGIATFDGVDSRERAVDFWRGIAFDDGLRAKDPRKTALRFLEGSRGSSRGAQMPISHGVANCWNAWFKNIDLSLVKLPQERRPIILLGTKFRGVKS